MNVDGCGKQYSRVARGSAMRLYAIVLEPRPASSEVRVAQPLLNTHPSGDGCQRTEQSLLHP